MIDCQPAGRAAVDAREAITGEERPTGDLSALKSGNPDDIVQPDDVWPRVAGVTTPQTLGGLFQDLSLFFQDQIYGAVKRAHVDGLVGGIQDKHLGGHTR